VPPFNFASVWGFRIRYVHVVERTSRQAGIGSVFDSNERLEKLIVFAIGSDYLVVLNSQWRSNKVLAIDVFGAEIGYHAVRQTSGRRDEF